jgi:SAM-dependent methyltransferase
MNKVTLFYDDRMFRLLSQEYYGFSDFYNWGYWRWDTCNQKEASENLVEKLLSFIPEKCGAILDVGCGMGATTRYLHRYYPSEHVTGINISAKQLARSTVNAPGSHFSAMDAAALGFADCSFANLICVESAMHFNTRRQFLAEAKRVLQPGGRLVLTDIVFTQLPKRTGQYFPEANATPNLNAYRDLYREAGFAGVDVIDATQETWLTFRRKLDAWSLQKLRRHEISLSAYIRGYLAYAIAGMVIKHYVLVSAWKAG